MARAPGRRFDGKTACGIDVRFTQKPGELYVHLLGTPKTAEFVVTGSDLPSATSATTWPQELPFVHTLTGRPTILAFSAFDGGPGARIQIAKPLTIRQDCSQQKSKNCGSTPMKFTWFNLMPWPYLPDDFREKNRSVWVDIDQRLFDPARATRSTTPIWTCSNTPADWASTASASTSITRTATASCPRPTSSPPRWRAGPRTSASSCWAIPSRSTIRRCAWPRSSRCSTASRAGGWWPASRSAPRWTPTTATARFRP